MTRTISYLINTRVYNSADILEKQFGASSFGCGGLAKCGREVKFLDTYVQYAHQPIGM